MDEDSFSEDGYSFSQEEEKSYSQTEQALPRHNKSSSSPSSPPRSHNDLSLSHDKHSFSSLEDSQIPTETEGEATVSISKRSAYSNVTHRGYVSARKLKALDDSEIMADILVPCGCELQCNTCMNVPLVRSWRTKVHSLPMGFQQQQCLLNLYKETIFGGSYSHPSHILEGKRICSRSWYSILMGISLSSYTRIKRVHKNGIHTMINQPKGRPQGELGQDALAFLQNYVDMVSDVSPQCDRLILPMGITVLEMFRKYQRSRNGHKCIKEARFYKIWKDNFKHVSFQKHCKLSKCSVCMQAKHLLQQNLHPEVQQNVMTDWEEHLARQQNERQSYYRRRDAAIMDPTGKTSIIVDGMDQAKTNLPHFKGWNNPKDRDPTKVLSTHIIGCHVHNTKTTYALLDANQYPHDVNITISCLLYSLIEETQNGQMTPVIYIQLDNTSRENKNKYFMGFMAYLIAMDYTKEIILSFLMVGHTHEDIDGRFSRISQALGRKDAKTVPDLLDVILNSSQGMKPKLTQTVFNIREWMAPYISDIHNHTHPHVYRFDKHEGTVRVQYKHWSTDEEWLPKQGDSPIQMFKLSEDGIPLMPQCPPSVLEPDYEKKHKMADIKTNISVLKKYLTYREQQWWEAFLDEPHAHLKQDCGWYLERISVIRPNAIMPSVSNEETSPLSLAMEKERAKPEIFHGKKRVNEDKTDKTSKLAVAQKKKRKLSMNLGYMVGHVVDDELTVGKVCAVGDTTLTLVTYTGTLNGVWEAGVSSHGITHQQTVSKSAIKEDMIFALTPRNTLPGQIKDKFKGFF